MIPARGSAARFTLIVGLAACLGGARPPALCAWQAGEVLELRGTVSQGGLSGPFVRWVELGSGRMRETRDLGIVRSASGYDGRLAWSQDVSGASHDLDSGFARALARSEAWLAGEQDCLAAPKGPRIRGARIRDAGVETEAGHRLRALEAQPAGGAAVQLWTEAETGRPARAVLQYAENRLVRRWSDWRDIGGGRFVAFVQTDTDPEDADEIAYRVATARVVAKAPGGFSRPAPPRDVRMLGGRASTTVPYEDDDRTRIYLPVYLDGKGPFTFELDNGGHFILAAETALAVGLTSKGAFSATGAGTAISESGYARIQELRVGDAVITDQPAHVRALSAAANDRGARPPRAGILGIELFERFTVAIDRARHTVTLTPRGSAYPTPKGTPLPIVFAEDAPLTPGAIEGRRGDLMLDIGDAGPTIVEEPWAAPRGLDRLFAGAPRIGDASLARGTVAVGPFKLPGELLSYYGRVERGSESTRAVAAVLGEPLLSRFDATYDVARKTVWLSPARGGGLKPFNRAGVFLAKGTDSSFSVSAVWPGAPAEAAGLKAGMTVSAIDGAPLAGWSRADVAKAFEKPAGAVVRLTVRDAAGERTVEMRLRDLL